MALQMQDIFPLSTTQGTANTAVILEPYACASQYNDPTVLASAEVRLVFTKKMSHPYYMFQYTYKGIMTWEYQLIEEFYKRMNGQYEVFYAVDWTARYRILGATTGSLTLDRTDGLDNEVGFGGNTLLIYNPIKTGINKQILTISAAETFSDTTISVNETVTVSLANTLSTYAYILYPCMFDSTSLQATVVDFCIQKETAYYRGFGDKYLYGNILDINIPLIQVGVMK